jgi:hypothetical protein
MYDLKLGQNGHLVKKINQNNNVPFMPHACSQSRHLLLVNADILIKLNLLKSYALK